jgi:hypothetical protein
MGINLNIRGTSGSGKSHLARRLLARYSQREPVQPSGAGRPRGYVLSGNLRPLFVLGHYEGDHGGGADNVSDREEGFGLLTHFAQEGHDLFWEGVIYSDEVTRTLALSRIAETHIIVLATPIEQCLADVRARREAKGNLKPLSEKNTVSRVASIISACNRLKYGQSPGLPKQNVETLGREEAWLRCIELLGL